MVPASTDDISSLFYLDDRGSKRMDRANLQINVMIEISGISLDGKSFSMIWIFIIICWLYILRMKIFSRPLPFNRNHRQYRGDLFVAIGNQIHRGCRSNLYAPDCKSAATLAAEQQPGPGQSLWHGFGYWQRNKEHSCPGDRRMRTMPASSHGYWSRLPQRYRRFT